LTWDAALTAPCAASDHGCVPKGPRPPYLVVADALRERIDSGEWLPGEALPSITALSAEYAVSTSTAGRAIRVLANEGRVTTVQGWGSFVSDRTK
jgi:DNA-binding GntR family transcriptional regulator